MDDNDIFLIEVARRGRDGDYAGASEVAALKTRADALEARANITSLDAVPNVDAPSPSAEQYLKYNGTSWIPASVTGGISQWWNQGTESWQGTYDRILALDPVYFFADDPAQPTMLKIHVALEGTGSSARPARSDHTHNNPAHTRVRFAATGYMSSGTRSLVSTTVTLLAGIQYRVKATLKVQMRGADAGACYYQLRTIINNIAYTSDGGATNGFWCVQGVPNKEVWDQHETITGTGAAITVSAEVLYWGGGGFYVDAGDLLVEPKPNR